MIGLFTISDIENAVKEIDGVKDCVVLDDYSYSIEILVAVSILD